MGTPLSPEQTKRLEEYQAKWLRIALSTEPIDPSQATDAVKNAYRINGFKEPQIHLCGSPYAGMQKLVELTSELGDLGEGLNQEIQLHNEWCLTHQEQLSEYQGEITRPLGHILYLFRPLELDLQAHLLYRPQSELSAYPLPQAENSTEDPLELYAQFMQDACAMPPSLFYNRISTDSLADAYCGWEFGFSVLNWAHSAEKWAASVALLASCGWVMPFEKVCVICDRPSQILVDDLQRLHAIGEPAIAFRDGYGVYVHHGVLLDNGHTALTIQDYIEEPKPQFRQAIVEQTPVEELPLDWLLHETHWAVREVLLSKLSQQRIAPMLEIASIGLSDELLVSDLGPLLWLVHSVLENRDNPHIQRAIDAMQSSNGTNLEKLNILRKTLMTDALNRIMTWLESNAPSSAAAFAPGLEPEALRLTLDALPFKLPQEVHDLYCWRNGTEQHMLHRLFYDFVFRPLEDAIACAGYMNEEFKEIRQLEGDLTYLFPIFDLEKDYFVVAGNSTSISISPVYMTDCIDPTSLAFNSLTAMMLTIAEAYESGVYTVDAEGDVDCSNTDLFGEIARKYNVDPPGRLFY
jgi:hypothetical protein